MKKPFRVPLSKHRTLEKHAAGEGKHLKVNTRRERKTYSEKKLIPRWNYQWAMKRLKQGGKLRILQLIDWVDKGFD